MLGYSIQGKYCNTIRWLPGACVPSRAQLDLSNECVAWFLLFTSTLSRTHVLTCRSLITSTSVLITLLPVLPPEGRGGPVDRLDKTSGLWHKFISCLGYSLSLAHFLVVLGLSFVDGLRYLRIALPVCLSGRR